MKNLIYFTILSMFVFGSFGVMAEGETTVTDASGNTLCERDPETGKTIKTKATKTKTGTEKSSVQETCGGDGQPAC
jgi:hypothetical protein